MTHAIRFNAATQGLVGGALQFERLQPIGTLTSSCVSIDAGRCWHGARIAITAAAAGEIKI
jgi:hypothetical protein